MHKLHKLFYPDSVAVAGVSPKPDNMAAMIIRNIVNWNFKGRLFGVNPTFQGEVNGIRVYPNLEAIPDAVDLLVILSPARTAPDLLDQCRGKGVRFAVIESSGFSEFSQNGAQLGAVVMSKAREYGIRFTGPNGLGILNADNGLCTPFSYLLPFPRGNISVVSQSGGVGLALALGLQEHGLYANKLISMGNKYDLDESDYLEYLLQDSGTDVILMFLESIKNGRRFMELAARGRKPVIVYKGNVTEAGRQRAQSHTASLANDDAVVDAAFRQAGVVRARNLTDLIHFARMFTQPRLKGNRLMVISPAGGYTVIAADECSKAGFTFPPLGRDTLRAVRKRFRAGVIRIENPMDLGDALAAESVLIAIERSLMQKNADACLVMIMRRSAQHYVGAFSNLKQNIIPAVEALVKKIGKPVVFNVFGLPEHVAEMRGGATIPVYSSMDVAVRALSAYRDYCASRRGGAARAAFDGPPSPAPEKAQKILAAASNGPLLGKKAFDLLRAFEISAPACAEAATAAQAVAAADKLKYPVAMKIVSQELSHKSDAGGVILNINDKKAAAVAAKSLMRIMENHKAVGTILVQKMAAPGVELIVGAHRDPTFGPVVVFGAGGVFVEILRDTALRMAPVSHEQALEMINSLSGAALLRGARGLPPVDMDAVAKIIVAVSHLAAGAESVRELDINPLIVTKKGCLAVDARIEIAD